MAVTDFSALIDALTIAIATGARSISYEGKSISYGSTTEMIQALAWAERRQAAQNGAPRPIAGKAAFSRGYRTRGLAPGLLSQRYDEDR